MKILLLTQWFDPEPNNMKGLIFAKELKNRGHYVEVLTGLPNYPTGKLYNGYHYKLYQKEWMEDILIHRVLLYPSHDKNVLKRILNYSSFAFFATILAPFVMKGKFDVIYVYHPPATTMLPAILLKKLKRAKLLLDINDLWPDTLEIVGMMDKKWFLKILGMWMNYCYKKADEINVLSIGIKRILELREVPFYKIHITPVWCNEMLMTTEQDFEFIEKYDIRSSFVLMYAGAIGKAQHLETLLEAAKILQWEDIDFKLFIIGHGLCLEELKEFTLVNDLKNVIFVPVVPAYELSKILNIADVLLIHLKKEEIFQVTIPSKIPYYLNLGKAIVAGLEGDAGDIIRKSQGGIVCDSEEPSQMAKAIKEIYSMPNEERKTMGELGRKYYEEELSLESGINKLETIMINMKNSKKRF